jgi:prepilin-type N-terminal cleavage/methylation domain-containing protein
MRRGFTLVELAFVVAVIGVLVAATVPTYQALVARARADEARSMLHAIADAELRHFRDQGRFLACEPKGAVPKGAAPFPNNEPCWKALGIVVAAPVRYRYSAALDADSFNVTAEGDLDGDGQPSRFTLKGRTFAIDVQDELE